MKTSVMMLSLMMVLAFGCERKPAVDPAKPAVEPAKVEAEAVKPEEAKPAEAAPGAKPEEAAKPAEAVPEAKPEEVKKPEPVRPAPPPSAAGEIAIEPEENATGRRIEVQFFVMSQCPFGVQVLDGIAPVLKKVGNFVDFKAEYIGDDKDGKLTAMHGESEVKGNIAHVCVMKYHAENYAYIDAISCMNKNYRALPGNWEECAKANMPEGAFNQAKACFDGQEGQDLLRTSYALAKEKGARGSPTMFLGGKPYRGGRGEADYLRAICGEYQDAEKPKFCASLPKPVEVSCIVVEDKRCTDRTCDTGRLVSSLEGMFPGLKVARHDWATDEAKKIYEDEGLQYLPAVMFDDSVDRAPEAARLKRYLQRTRSGKYQVLQIGAKHDPKAEICNNNVDDTGNGLVDCADPTCVNTLECRAEVPGQVEVFVMSQCPFGVKAMNAVSEALPVFSEDPLNIKIHFIADEKDGVITAMHGDPEVKGNIVQICAMKYYGDKYAYMKTFDCINENYRALPGNWEECAKKAGMPEDVFGKVKACFEGPEGNALLSEDIKIGKSLGISASPTWIANGKHKFSGIDGATLQRNVCQHNPTFKGCAPEKRLAPPAQGGAPAGSCGG